MSDVWPTVPKITDNVSTFSANSINPSLDALEQRTVTLNDKLKNLTGVRGLSYTDTGFDSSVKRADGTSKGMLIAFDPDTNKYIPAAAAFSSEVRADGSLSPAPSSFVVGVLTTDIVDGYATIMTYGFIDDAVLVDYMTNNGASSLTSPVIGDYYLTNSGCAVKGKASAFELPVYCFSVVSSDASTGCKVVFSPKSPEYSGHSHSSVKLELGWTSVSVDQVPTALVARQPEGVSVHYSKYDYTTDAAVNSVLSAKPQNPVLVINGVLASDRVWIDDHTNKAIFVASLITTTDEVILNAINPFTGREALVHSIESTTPAILPVTNANGNVKIGLNLNATETEDTGGRAVTQFTEDGIVYGPIVQKLIAGPGVTLKPVVNGSGDPVPGILEICATTSLKTHIPLNVTNLNGVLLGTLSDRVSYVFPAGVKSSLHGSLIVPNFESPTPTGRITVMVRGTGAMLPPITVSILSQPIPVSPTDAVSLVTTASEYTVRGADQSTDVDKVYTMTADVGQEVRADSLLSCTVLVDNDGSNALNVLSISIQLD